MKKNSAAIKTIYVVILAIILTGAIVGAGTWYFTRPTTSSSNSLEIYDWWTSGGESAAINALVGVYQSQYPNVVVIQSPVAGGAGYVFRSVIKPLVLAGQAPDAFQVHAGYEMYPYVAGGYLDPIDDLWSSQNWSNIFPSVISSDVYWGGHYYGIPVDIHRPNVLWYNKPILDANGINATSITTWTQFFAACDKLNSNTTLTSSSTWSSPIALGDQDGWEATHVLEQILVGQGIPFYQNFINGQITSASDANLTAAINVFAQYLNYTNANHASLTWDEAAALVINGNCAFNIMGDWNNGEFKLANKTYNVDYGTIPVPGTSGDYGLVVDCFEHPAGVKDPTNSLNWLKVVGSVAGQNAFNPLKGSIPARGDAAAQNLTAYGPYQQAAMADFSSASYYYPSIVHGSAMPQSFTNALPTVITTFVTNSRNKSSTSAINTLASAITQAVTASKQAGDFVKTWQIPHN